MTVAVGEKMSIGERLTEAVGRRSQAVVAEKMGLSRTRLIGLQNGDVPNAWLYLARLRREGVDLNWLLTGD